MQDVVALKQADRSVGLYKRLYQTQYGSEPLIDNEIEFQIFLKKLIIKLGEEHVNELIKFYLRSNDNWYQKKAHNAQTFMSDASTLNGLFSKSLSRYQSGPTYDPMIIFETKCPKCEGWHHITCKGSEMEKHAYTTHCKTCIEVDIF